MKQAQVPGVDVNRFESVQRDTRDENERVGDSERSQQERRGGSFRRVVAAELQNDERQHVSDEAKRTQGAADDRVQGEVEEGTVGRQHAAEVAVGAAAVGVRRSGGVRHVHLAQIARHHYGRVVHVSPEKETKKKFICLPQTQYQKYLQGGPNN